MECFVIQSGEIKGRLDCLYNLAIKESSSEFRYQTKELFKLVKNVSGGTPSKSNPAFWQGNIPWASPKDFRSFYLEDTEDHISGEAVENSSTRIIPVNSVLVVVRSGILAHTLPVAVIRKPMAINQDVRALIPNPESGLLAEYLGLYLTVFGKKLLPLITKHSTTVQSINTDQFSELPIPLPPLKTQKQIVQIMDAAYEAKKQKVIEAEQLLNSIDDYLLDALGIKIPPLEDKRYFRIESAEVAQSRIDPFFHQPKFKTLTEVIESGRFKTKSLGECITNIHYGASLKNNYVTKGIPFLRILNLKQNYFNLTKVVNLPEQAKNLIGNAFVREGDLLISRSGSLGIVAVVPKEAGGFAFGSFMIRFCLNEQVNKFFVSIWLNSRLHQMFVQRERIGAIQGNITIETIRNFKIPAPPMDIQNRTAQEVKDLMRKAESLKEEAQAELETAKMKVEKMILGKDS